MISQYSRVAGITASDLTGAALKRERAQEMVDRYLRMTIDELTADLGGSNPAWEIAQQANLALRELSGSISRDAAGDGGQARPRQALVRASGRAFVGLLIIVGKRDAGAGRQGR